MVFSVNLNLIYVWVNKGLEGNHLVLGENPPAMPRSPHIRMAQWPKTAVKLKVYWRRERAHDKTGKRVVCLVCCAGTFIG